MTYAIFSNSNKLTKKSVLQYLKQYHAQYFPLIEKDKIYRQVSNNLFLLRVAKYSSPGDILGYLTQKLSLSTRDSFYCIPINEELSDRISEKTEQSLNYIYDKNLNQLSDIDDKYTKLEYKLTDAIYFLAHYLDMLERTSKYNKITNSTYILVDKYAQWKSKKLYGKEYAIDRYNRGKRNQRLVYTRFDYDDLIEDAEFQNIPLIEASKLLGFNIKFQIVEVLQNQDLLLRMYGIEKDRIYDEIDEKIWNNKNILVGIIFIGNENWKETIQFEIDLKFYNNTRKNTTSEYLMLFEKPKWKSLN